MIFVTGGTGLVGSHILLELANKQVPIVALKRPTSDLKIIQSLFKRNQSEDLLNRIEWVEGDLSEVNHLIQLMKNADVVYHCAALVSFDSNDRLDLIETNIEGTSNLIDAAVQTQVKKLVYLSSTSAIGKQPKVEVIDETCEWNPDNKNGHYSFSKHYAEREVWRGIEEGLNAVIVNPAVILGPGNWHTSSTRMFKSVFDGLKFYSNGANAFVDVRDVAQVAIKLADSGIKNERFLVFSENMDFRTVLNLMAKHLEKKAPQFYATPVMGYIAGLVSEIWSVIGGTKPLVTRESARSANSIQVYSNQKINSAIDHEFITVEQSIKDTSKVLLV